MQLVVFGDDVNVAKAATDLPFFSLSWQLHVAQLQRKLEAYRDFPLAFPPSAEAFMGCDGSGCYGDFPVKMNIQFSCSLSQHMQSVLLNMFELMILNHMLSMSWCSGTSQNTDHFNLHPIIKARSSAKLGSGCNMIHLMPLLKTMPWQPP